MADITEIGIIRSKFREPADPFEMRKHESTIVVHEAFADGLYRLEEHRLIQVFFHFHKGDDGNLIAPRRNGETRGVFASRSPNRPGRIGMTTVRLLERRGIELRVSGLDAIDGTPVLDLKPYVPAFDTGNDAHLRRPRADLAALVEAGDTHQLLSETGRLHGHFCPGVSLGVMAATFGLHRLAEARLVSVGRLLEAEGLEELLAIVEVNSCFVDGIQLVTGCTLGNNGLVYRDYGKTAVTLCDRTGAGLRVVCTGAHRDTVQERAPDFAVLFDRVVKQHDRDPEVVARFAEESRRASFAVLEADPARVFAAAPVRTRLPDYAPMRESLTCAVCGESVMAGKAETVAGETRCRPCAGAAFGELTGEGIRCAPGQPSAANRSA
jgi:formylmethanofuran dehydrogenase subunit E